MKKLCPIFICKCGNKEKNHGNKKYCKVCSVEKNKEYRRKYIINTTPDFYWDKKGLYKKPFELRYKEVEL